MRFRFFCELAGQARRDGTEPLASFRISRHRQTRAPIGARLRDERAQGVNTIPGPGATGFAATRSGSLLGQDYPGPAHFGRVVLQLGKAILHWQHGLGIVDVHA